MKKNNLLKIFKNKLNDKINKLCIYTVGRKNKYDNFVYINYILRVLFFGDCWTNLIIDSKHQIEKSTIRKKFYLWRDKGIFQAVYEDLFLLYSKNRTFKNLFIDSTCIQNMNCSDEKVCYYYKIKSKKQIKLSIISNGDNIPISINIHKPIIHDSQLIKPLIKTIKVNIKNNTNLIGDKGYISKQKKYIKKGKIINLICEPRKNQKKKFSKKNVKLYKSRYIVEQTFSHIKRSYKRLSMIYDRKLINFETFLIMGISCQIIRKIYNENSEI